MGLVNNDYNSPDSPFTISKTAGNINSLTCSVDDFDIVINKKCESYCNISDYCGNVGFEDGDYDSEWTGYMGKACSDTSYGSNFCHSFYKVDFSDPDTDPVTSTNPTYNTNIAKRIKYRRRGMIR